MTCTAATAEQRAQYEEEARRCRKRINQQLAQEAVSERFEAELERFEAEFHARYLVIYEFRVQHGRAPDRDELDRLLPDEELAPVKLEQLPIHRRVLDLLTVNLRPFTRGEMTQLKGGKYCHAADIQEALDDLLADGLVRRVQITTGNFRGPRTAVGWELVRQQQRTG